ncbi:MAG: tRNA (N6-isopentenyl adenosine(37)-C2)-methylthiotransferase MiaB [Cellulosilyticaceae bacterium]
MGERKVIEVSTEESKRQHDIMLQLSKKLKDKNLKYCVSTFGCQMNAHDSEKIEGMLEQMGYTKTTEEQDADFVLYNTCCVRENAEMKIFGKLGFLKALKRKKPNLIVGVCGCMMQQDIVIEKLKKSYRHVDLIFGTYNTYKLPELLQTRFETGKPVIDIWESHEDIVEDLPSIRKHKFKSCTNIMYGCNNFCTYCIVPYVRGRERSREAADIIKEIKYLVSDGVTEITLLGQNVNSYGKNLNEPIRFSELLEQISQIEGLKRIRFMTSHPKDLSDDLIDVIAKHDNICKSIHLPFQSGSDKILKSMNRNYTKEQYLDLVHRIKTKIPEAHITTDIIIGFPGETEEDVLDTIDVVKKVRFSSAYTFIYSKRTGTPAATMENQVPENLSKERFNKLVENVKIIAAEIMADQIGKTTEVLLEDTSKSEQSFLSGRTDTGLLVHVEADKSLLGTYQTVNIISAKTHYLVGSLQ